jgi:hypothetical protein
MSKTFGNIAHEKAKKENKKHEDEPLNCTMPKL